MITINATPNNNGAAVSGEVTDKSLIVGDNIITLTVTGRFLTIKIAWNQPVCNQVSTPLSPASCSTPYYYDASQTYS